MSPWWSNKCLASSARRSASHVLIDVSSPNSKFFYVLLPSYRQTPSHDHPDAKDVGRISGST